MINYEEKLGGGEGIKNNYQIFRNLPKNLKLRYGYQILTNYATSMVSFVEKS